MLKICTLLRAARPSFHISCLTSWYTHATRSTKMKCLAERRWQSTDIPKVKRTWLKNIWNSPIGVKTVHFWAPFMKWMLLLVGISDFNRPAEKLSATQNVALTATGMIWTRWCFVIKPRNILLAAANFSVGIVGLVQVSRIFAYNYNYKGQAVGQQIEHEPIPTASTKGTLVGALVDIETKQ